jgi:hypothetical protein
MQNNRDKLQEPQANIPPKPHDDMGHIRMHEESASFERKTSSDNCDPKKYEFYETTGNHQISKRSSTSKARIAKWPHGPVI